LNELQAVTDLIANIPVDSFPVCHGGAFWQPSWAAKDKIGEYQHARFNNHRFLNVIAVDMDQPDSVLQCCDIEPRIQPNVLVEGNNGHGHAIYFVSQPMYLGCAKVIQFAKDIRARAVEALAGDRSFNNLWVKSPTNTTDYRLHVFKREPHELRDLGSYLPHLPTYADMAPRALDVALGRNVALFGELTRWAASHPQRHAAGWRDVVLAQANLLNSMLAIPMSLAEVRSIAKSVANYRGQVWRTNPNWDIGKLGLKGTGISHAGACRAGAEYASRMKKEKSEHLVQAARELNPCASQREIARVTGLSRNTVARCWLIGIL
jgi:hypothetical protein